MPFLYTTTTIISTFISNRYIPEQRVNYLIKCLILIFLAQSDTYQYHCLRVEDCQNSATCNHETGACECTGDYGNFDCGVLESVYKLFWNSLLIVYMPHLHLAELFHSKNQVINLILMAQFYTCFSNISPVLVILDSVSAFILFASTCIPLVIVRGWMVVPRVRTHKREVYRPSFLPSELNGRTLE